MFFRVDAARKAPCVHFFRIAARIELARESTSATLCSTSFMPQMPLNSNDLYAANFTAVDSIFC